MGVGRRMKKQGPPPSLKELELSMKRKAEKLGIQTAPPLKRRKSGRDDVKDSPTKFVKLDRAIRPEREAFWSAKKQKKANLREVNEDAQVTIPPPTPVATSQPEDAEDEILEDAEEEETPGSQSDIDEAVVENLNDLDSDQSLSDSVFDSDQDDQPKGMFSEDERDSDAEEKLTAANIEGLSRKLDQQQEQIDAEAQEELEDAMQTNIAGDEVLEDDDTMKTGLAPDLQLIRNRMTETIRILNDLSKLSENGKSRAEYISRLLSDICTYYGYTPYLAEKLFNLFTPMEAFAFFEANESPRPVVLRTNTLRTNRRTLAQALINRGVVLEPVGKWSKVGLQIFESAVPLGATPEYLAGHYILQAASSFLPVMALAPQPGERVLDMAAAPGGKTTYISSLMRNTGTVFANDANKQRAKGLIGNVHRLGCKNVIVCNLDAKDAFPKTLGGFDRVLLDAPCSGTGVIGKDPSVKTSKTERDFMLLPHMQKQLLLAAIDSVDHTSKTGGYVVYSTCSVTVEENESVVQYILRKRPNVKIAETGLGSFGSEGYKSFMGKTFDPKMVHARRYFPHRENVDGFFVCKLKKTGPTPGAKPITVNGDAHVQSAPIHTGKHAPSTNGPTNANAIPVLSSIDPERQEDGFFFGGFDDEQDAAYIAAAERKRLRKRGLDPRTASYGKGDLARNGDDVPLRGDGDQQQQQQHIRTGEAVVKKAKEKDKSVMSKGMEKDEMVGGGKKK